MVKGKNTKRARIVLIFALMLSILLGFGVETSYAQTNAKTDDPEFWKAQGYVSDGFYDEASGTSTYGISRASARNQVTRKLGVDVSKYQGNIDWAKAKANGVEFAIIRVGYRGSSTGTLNEDEYYRRNIEGALAQGIPVGVYMFSQAITEAEAIEEANYVLERIAKYDVSLPVVIDYEYAGQNGEDGRLYTANLSKAQATAICKAFCRTVQNNGYVGMVYANKSMLNSNLNAAEIAKDYPIWLAHYTISTDYAGDYDFWQYTSKGDGAAYGMQSQYVDLDYWYDDGSLYRAVYEGIDYSAVFNPRYYANVNGDVKAVYGYDSQMLLAHFVKCGMQEGRQAKSTFNVYSYKNLYADVRAAYGEDLKQYYLHYIKYGKNEGRIGTGYENVKPSTGSGSNGNSSNSTGQGSNTGGGSVISGVTTYNGVDYSDVYDYAYYIANNRDIYAAYGKDDKAVLRHFVEWGMQEGRQAKVTFNVYSYKKLYSDLRDAYGESLKQYYMHYIKYGKNEGRIGTGYENMKPSTGSGSNSNSSNSTGQGSNTGSGSAISGVTTYNGVDYSAVYDYAYYTANNKDVHAAYGKDDKATLRHFVEWGMVEGRQAKADFNVHVYRQKNRDLQNAYGSDLPAYYVHYVKWGKAEGRRAN